MHPYYVHQIFHELRIQADKLRELERQVQDLQKSLEDLKNKNTANIGPINYNFDQLKIEKLEGTLNIGLTPPSEDSNSGDATVNGLSLGSQGTNNKMLYEQIQPEIEKYIQNEVPAQFARMAWDKGVTVNQQYVQNVCQDLQQQMDGRIKVYLNQLPPISEGRVGDEALIASITGQIKQDIEAAVQGHMDWMMNERKE